MSEKSTDWIKPGAKVVVFTAYSRGDENPRVTTIAKVAKKSFTVETDGLRYSIDQQLTAIQGGSWGWRRKAVPFDSDEARSLLERARHKDLIWTARMAVEMWEKKRTRENRLAAIAALQAVEVDEGANED